MWISKSELKREALAVRKLGQQLLTVNAATLLNLPLSDDLLAAIQLAHNLKREALRRQLQYIGKLLRKNDYHAIEEALGQVKNQHFQQNILLHHAEKWCNQLLTEDNLAFSDFITQFPDTDHQHLRTSIRSAKKELLDNNQTKAKHQLLRLIRDCLLYK